MHLKLYYPELINKLVIIGSVLSLDPLLYLDRLFWQIKWELLLSAFSLKEFFFIWYQQELFKNLSIEKILFKREKINKFFHQKCLNQLNLFFQGNLEDSLAKYKKDFLFLHGNEDKAYKNYYSKLKKIGFKVKEVSHASHAVFLQQPKNTKQIIKRFFLYANDSDIIKSLDRN